MTDTLALTDVLDACIASVVVGEAQVPPGAIPVFDEPGLELRVAVDTAAGEVRMLYRPTADSVQTCELWGGDFSDPDRAFTVLWRDVGDRVTAWIDGLALRPDAIDRRDDPEFEALFLCPDASDFPIVVGAWSFRFEDEIEEEAPLYPPDGGLGVSANHLSTIRCADLKGRP